MQTIKRMAALLLAVALALSCLPASAFAAELPGEETTPAATEAAAVPPTNSTDPPATEETQPPEPAVTTETTGLEAPEETTAPPETTVPAAPPETTEPDAAAPTEGTTEPTGEATAPTEEPTSPTGETTVPTEAPTEPTDESAAPTVPEPAELYRAATEDGSVTAVLYGTAEEAEIPGFQVTAMEVTEELADNLALALHDYMGINYAPLAILPFQVGFPAGTLLGNFTLTLTLPGEQLQGDLFVFCTSENNTAVLPYAQAARNEDAGTVTVTIPLTELSSGAFTVATAEPIVVDGGSSGSTIGSPGPIGGGGSPGEGRNRGTSVGVTMQVVYYKYKDCYNRNNSYQCVIDTLRNISNNPHPALDDDGTVLSNTVLDGFTYLKYNTFWSGGAGQTIMAYQGPNYVSDQGSDVWNFIERIIFGSSYGAWNKKSVGESSSTYTKVLRMLGTPEDKIQNYLDSFNDKLSLEKDGDTLIPTILWAWYGRETISGQGTIEVLSGPILSYCGGASTSRGDKGFGNALLNTPTASPSSHTGYVNCYWSYNSTDSVTCKLLLGNTHLCHGPDVNLYDWQTTYGTGYVNRIQADGVDSNSRFYYFRGYWTPYGEIVDQPLTLHKSINASAECIAQLQGNAMYSLAGAKYDVIINDQVVETITTDANGNVTTKKKFKPGTSGVVVETAAPKGFRLDSTPVPFTVPTSGKCVVNVSDVPIMDPPFAITKVDKDTTIPQGDGSFSGAVFRFEYFDNEDWSGTAKRTWHFKTNESGMARYDPAFLAPGYTSDALYVDSNGTYQVLLGTVKITEIQNSLGYTVLPQPLKCSIVEDATSPYGARIVWTPESWDILLDMASGNFGVYEPIDTAVLGNLTIQKKDKDFGTTAPTWATFEGCEFTVYNRSAASVKVGENEIAQPGDACLTLTVDAAGQASSGNVFPVGTYEVKETKGNDYYQCNEAWSFTFTVTGKENNPAFFAECPDTMRPAALHLSKVDTEGRPLPGSKFCLEWSADGDAWAPVTKADDIIMGGCSSPELDDKGCLTIGESGTLSFTGLYPVVYYRITEVETPNGYQLLKDPILVEKLLPENNFENSFRVVNNDIFSLPRTGGYSFLATLIPAGFLLALSGSTVILLLFPARKRKNHV